MARQRSFEKAYSRLCFTEPPPTPPHLPDSGTQATGRPRVEADVLPHRVAVAQADEHGAAREQRVDVPAEEGATMCPGEHEERDHADGEVLRGAQMGGNLDSECF